MYQCCIVNTYFQMKFLDTYNYNNTIITGDKYICPVARNISWYTNLLQIGSGVQMYCKYCHTFASVQISGQRCCKFVWLQRWIRNGCQFHPLNSHRICIYCQLSANLFFHPVAAIGGAYQWKSNVFLQKRPLNYDMSNEMAWTIIVFHL